MLGLLNIEDLPQQSATQVKNKWGEVARQVLKSGGLAITNHANVEMVILEASVYQQLIGQLNALNHKEQSSLDALTERFNQQLQSLQAKDAHTKLEGLLHAKGAASASPLAGSQN